MTELTREQERAQRDREAVAKLQAENLMAQWETTCAAKDSLNAAKATYSLEHDRYTEMLAAALNVTVGMRVTRTRHRHGNQVPRTQTFEVTKFALYLPTTLTLWGRTVRKDGTMGEVFDIGTDWERAK